MKRYGMKAPEDGAGAALPAQVAVLEQLKVRAQTTDDPSEADALRRGAHSLREAMKREPRGAVAAELLVEVAECYAWGCRRLGELFPAAQGTRTDLEDDATSQGSPAKFSEPSRDVLLRCRQIASIPAAAFEAALVEAKQEQRPITQTALIKLAPKNPKKTRVFGMLESTIRELQRCVDRLQKLEDRAVRSEKAGVAGVRRDVESTKAAVEARGFSAYAGAEAGFPGRNT
jgi:hypothetical protein